MWSAYPRKLLFRQPALSEAPLGCLRPPAHIQMRRGGPTGQRGAVELWIMLRARDGANVHETLDAVGLQQQSDETLNRQGGVTDSKDSTLRPIYVRRITFDHSGSPEWRDYVSTELIRTTSINPNE